MAKHHNSVSVSGYIKSYGNMPFNFPVIECDDGKLYSIDASDDVKKLLLSKQGKLVSISGIIISEKENNSSDYGDSEFGRIIFESFSEIK
ncbi:MAG: hypothetical protein ACFNKL_07185 [Treponema sp.]